MINESNIPVLTDLIESDAEIDISDLGLGQEFATVDSNSEPQTNSAPMTSITPALEQEMRRILDEHMELAWQEIRLLILQSESDTDSESDS